FPVDEVPEDGTTTITAMASNAAGDSATSTVDVTVDTAGTPADTTPPDAPVINPVTGDNAIDSTEVANGFAVSGTAEAGSTVTLTVAGTAISKTATADANGAWSVDIAA